MLRVGLSPVGKSVCFSGLWRLLNTGAGSYFDPVLFRGSYGWGLRWCFGVILDI